MAHYAQAPCAKGTQRWVQCLVNRAPQLLDAAVGLGRIDWRSPLADDDYAEYGDESFLERLGITLTRRPLSTFWPRGGPQWDVLGRTQSGEVVLVEAKAHLNELYSPPMGATANASIARIQLSPRETAIQLDVPDGFDLVKQFYQLANRIAHAHMLHDLNGIPTKLAFVYFIGDRD